MLGVFTDDADCSVDTKRELEEQRLEDESMRLAHVDADMEAEALERALEARQLQQREQREQAEPVNDEDQVRKRLLDVLNDLINKN